MTEFAAVTLSSSIVCMSCKGVLMRNIIYSEELFQMALEQINNTEGIDWAVTVEDLNEIYNEQMLGNW